MTTAKPSPPSSRAAALLARVSLFADLPPEELSRLAASLRLLAYRAETLLFAEGDAGDRMYGTK
ncbi:MAG: hypothetical protein HGA45_12130 [Chloroflexales bacterium]|nr:hypothetical protein [Chloroflexales bacterium]